MGGKSSKPAEVKQPVTDPKNANAAAKVDPKTETKLTKDEAAAPKPVENKPKPAPIPVVEKDFYDDDDRKLPIDKSSRFRDKTYLGEKFPKPYGVVGPLKFDRFTDLFCFFLFSLCVVAFITLGVLAAANGNMDSMRQPMDSEGKRCGIDSEYERYPKLLMFKFDSPYKSVCVDKCPVFDYNQMKYNSTGEQTDYVQPVYYDNLTVTIETCKIEFLRIFSFEKN